MRRRTTIPYLCIVTIALVTIAGSSLFSKEIADDQTICDIINRAAEYRNMSQVDSAFTLADKAYRLYTQSPQLHDTTKIMAINAMSWAYYIMSDYDSSLWYADRALDLKNNTNAKEDTLLIAILSNKGSAYFKMKNYDSAIAVFERILDIITRMHDKHDPIIAKNLLNLGTIYHYADKYEKAEEYLTKSLHLIKNQVGTDNVHYIIASNNIANLYRDIGRLGESETYQLEALSLRKRLFGENSIEVAKSMLNLSNLYIQKGQYADALPLSSKAHEIFLDQVGYYHDYSYAAVINLARINNEEGHYEKSEELFLQALDIAQNVFGEESPDVATAMEFLATTYRLQGRFSETISMLNNALDIFISHFGEQNTQASSVLNQLSVNYLILGDYETAESLQLRALEIRTAIMGADNYTVANDIGNLAEIYRLKGDCQRALELQLHAISILDNIHADDNPQGIAAQKDLADIYHDLGEDDIADSLAHDVLNAYLLTFGECHPNIAYTYELLADIRYNRHEYEQAAHYYEKALEILGEYLGSNHPSLGEIEIALGRTLTHLGSYDRAADIFSEFMAHRQKFLDYAFPLSSEEQKLDIIRRFPILNADIIALALTSDKPRLAELAFEMVINGKAGVINAIKNERSTAICNLDDNLRAILDLHSEVRSKIASLAYVNIIENGEYITADSLQTLYHVHDSLEIELAQACHDLNRGNEKVSYTAHDIRKAIPDDGLLVEYYRCNLSDNQCPCNRKDEPDDERYIALVMSKQDIDKVLDLGPAETIDSLIIEVKQIFEDSYFEMNSPLAEDICNYTNRLTNRVADKILTPILDQYPDYDNIIIAPDGLLHLIPFEILTDNDKRFLVENYRFSYVTSGRDLLHHSDTRWDDFNAIIIADPDFNNILDDNIPQLDANDSDQFANTHNKYRNTDDCFSGGFVRLGYGAEECRAISDVLKKDTRISIELFIDRDARETVLKSLTAPPYLLHMITHGFYCGDTLQSTHIGRVNPLLKSGLAMAGANTGLGVMSLPDNGESSDDGILTAFEVSSLNLDGTDLVTLSACESGVGQTLNGEGVFGLRCAFQQAGAKSLLMSLWKIPDRETSQLMQYFYANWIDGESKSDALRHAELQMIADLRESYGYALPYLWGGFVLTGALE